MSSQLRKNPLLSSTIDNSKEQIKLNQYMRKLIFTLFCIIYFFTSSEKSILFYSSGNIKLETINKINLIFNLGYIIGIFIVIYLFNIYNRKVLIIISLLLKIFSLLIYLFTNNYFIINFFQLIQGFSNAFTYIYFPTWIDQFGFQNYKTLMFYLIQIVRTNGFLFGFLIIRIIGRDMWKWVLCILALFLIFIIFILIFIEQNFFSPKIFFSQHTNENDDKKISLFEEDEESQYEKNRNFSNWISIFNGTYIFIVLSRIIINFIFKAIDFYSIEGLTIEVKLDNVLFNIILGANIVFLIPFIFYLIRGKRGYNKKNLIFICIKSSIVTCIIGLIVFFVDENREFEGFLYFTYLILALVQIPILIEISFNSVPRNLKLMSYGINDLLCILLCDLIIPFIFNFTDNIFRNVKGDMKYKFVFNCIWFNLVFLIICSIFQNRKNESDINKGEFDNGNEMENIEEY